MEIAKLPNFGMVLHRIWTHSCRFEAHNYRDAQRTPWKSELRSPFFPSSRSAPPGKRPPPARNASMAQSTGLRGPREASNVLPSLEVARRKIIDQFLFEWFGASLVRIRGGICGNGRLREASRTCFSWPTTFSLREVASPFVKAWGLHKEASRAFAEHNVSHKCLQTFWKFSEKLNPSTGKTLINCETG